MITSMAHGMCLRVQCNPKIQIKRLAKKVEVRPKSETLLGLYYV